MASIRQDLTAVLVRLKTNDWITVIENENENIETIEGKFLLYTSSHLQMFRHNGQCNFDRIQIDLNNIVSITYGDSQCPNFEARK